MSGKTRKRTGVKLIGLVAGAVLMMGLASPCLTPCSGMDTMTLSEMGGLSGQSGITLALGSTVTLGQQFRSISFGDPDGWGNSQDDNAGWIVLIGVGGLTWGYINIVIPCGTIMDFDVATAGNTTCTPSPYAGVKVPPNTSFFKFSLTEFYFELINPETVYIRATYNPTITAGSMDPVGWMKPTGLSIEKSSIKSSCYIWAHDRASWPP